MDNNINEMRSGYLVTDLEHTKKPVEEEVCDDASTSQPNPSQNCTEISGNMLYFAKKRYAHPKAPRNWERHTCRYKINNMR